MGVTEGVNKGRRPGGRARMPLAMPQAIGGIAVGSMGSSVIIGAVLARPASAASGCVGPIGNHFDGYTFNNNGSGFEGVLAYVQAYRADTCTPHENNDFYSAWSMLHADNCSWGYAQSGYNATYPNTSPYDFAQQATCTGTLYSNFPTSSTYLCPLGSSSKYFTQPDGTGGVESGVFIGNTAYLLEDTGASKDWSGTKVGEFYGEVGHDENDMPATSSAPANFTNINFDYSGTWSSSYGSTQYENDQPGSWGLSSVSSNAFNQRAGRVEHVDERHYAYVSRHPGVDPDLQERTLADWQYCWSGRPTSRRYEQHVCPAPIDARTRRCLFYLQPGG